MKVLHVQKVRGVAGCENYLFEILPALKAASVDVEFLALVEKGDGVNNDAFYDRLASKGVPLQVQAIDRLPTPSSLRALARRIRAGGFDIVHTHLVHADTYVALVKPFLGRTSFVSTKHGYEERFSNDYGFDPTRRRRDLYFFLCRLAEKRTTRSYAISHGLRRFFVQSGISDPQKIDVIHYGFDLSVAANDADLQRYRFGTPQLALVGRLVRFKGHRWALSALVEVRRRFPGVKLVIVGGGPLEQELRSEAVRLGLVDAVVFTGFQSDVRNYMAASDLVLVPSVSEGFGVVFLEAFASGRPVLAFDVPAANEIIEPDRSGVLVEPYDVRAYAAAISRLLSDPRECARLADGGRRRLETYFNRDRMLGETLTFYRRALAK